MFYLNIGILLIIAGVIFLIYKKKMLSLILIVIGIIPLAFFVVSISFNGFGSGVSDYQRNLAGGFRIVRMSDYQVTIESSSFGGTIIPATVAELAYNDSFIIAKQQGLKRKYPNNSANTYKIPDESINNYWIIDINTKKVYGPLNKSAFDLQRIQLKIPDDLKLKAVE